MSLAFIVPRYGPDILGGVETFARYFAEETAAAGRHVEVWTTCATDYYSWQNTHTPGREEQHGVVVHRFPISHWDRHQYAALNKRLHRFYTLPVAEQYAWLRHGPHSLPLYEHVAGHASQFEALIVLPYLSSITFYAAWAAPERVIMFPCLHNEIYTYMQPFRLLLESVSSVLFLSPEECHLATGRLHMRLRHHDVLGMGVGPFPTGQPPQQRATSPYLLYSGRLEEAKNLATLYKYVQRYVDEGGELQLVITGRGGLKPPDHAAFDLRGFVSEDERRALTAAALALCQPSLNESFSIVMMESWLAGRPVLVHEKCAVTRGHVQRSNGGLTFATYEQFRDAVTWLLAHPEEADSMGRNGRVYVQQNYTWPTILDRFAAILASRQKKLQKEGK